MAQTKVTSPGIADDAVTVAKIPNTSITNAKLANSSITIDGVTVALGASATVVTSPTITSLTPSVVPNTSTAVVIAGTNFTNMPSVEAINSTGAIVAADSITYTSATSITATFTLPVDGTYYVRVENPDGVAVRTATAALTVSDLPAWVTASGTLGTFSWKCSNCYTNFNSYRCYIIRYNNWRYSNRINFYNRCW